MFKKSDDNQQSDVFSSQTENFRDSKKKKKNKYLKNDSRHNRFRNHVVMQVDESVFSVLYTEGKGTPNASIRWNQILEFQVSGKQVRMDSKLIGNNTAWYSRYELIHETLRLFIKEREEFIFKRNLSKEELSLIESIQSETGNKVVYRGTKAGIDTRLIELGKLMYRFIGLFKRYDYGSYKTIKTVFERQYSVSEDKTVLPPENGKIGAKSIQSLHDTDCHYRDKDGNKVKSYSVNITETCDREQEGQGQVQALARHKLWAYSRSLWINFVRIVNYCVKQSGQNQACLSYTVASNSLTSVKYITQICQRPLFRQKSPHYTANLCFNMYIYYCEHALN